MRYVLLLLTAFLMAVACSDGSRQWTPSPTASAAGQSPTATAAATALPTSSPAAAPTGQPLAGSVSERLENIQAQVAELRGLTFLRAVDARSLSREEFAERTLSELHEEETEDLAVVQDLYTLLDLIPPNDDVVELELGIAESQVVGFYDLDAGSLFLIQDEQEFTATDESILAHEYTHALQDQHFDFGAAWKEEEDWDRRAALLALVEGDATLTEIRYAVNYQNASELAAQGEAEYQQALAQLDEYPPALVRELEFPYREGSSFVLAVQLRRKELTADSMFSDPPVSTEQILHPSKYLESDLPHSPGLPDLTSRLGRDWRLAASNTMGEFGLRNYLLTQLDDDEASSAAYGWRGDRWALYKTDDGRSLFLLKLAWDSPDESSDFFLSYLHWLDARSGGQWHRRGDPSEVEWLSVDKSIYARTQLDTTVVVITTDQEALKDAAAASR